MNEWKSDIVRVEEFAAHLKDLSDDGYSIFSAVQHSVDGYYLIVSYPNPGTSGQFTFGPSGLTVKDQGVITAINALTAVVLGGELPENSTGLATYDEQLSGNTFLSGIKALVTSGNGILDQIASQSGDTETSGTQLWELDQLRQSQEQLVDYTGPAETSGTQLWELDQIRQGGETLINLLGDAETSGSQLWYSDQILEYMKANLFSKFRSGEVLSDQTGVGGVLTFTFSQEMDLIWVRTDDGDACRVDPFGGTPTANRGIQCDTGVVTPINFSTTTLKIYAANGYVKVWGVKY